MSPYGMIVEKNGDISESEKNYIVSRLYDIFIKYFKEKVK